MVSGADNKDGKTFYGNTLREAQEKAAASEKVVINESFAKPKENITPIVEEKKLTIKEIFGWSAKKQKVWLKEKNITPAKYEDDRVDQIYKNQ